MSKKDAMNVKAEILYQYPYPIALTYHNADNAREAVGAHDQRIRLFEVTLKFLSSIAVAQYLNDKLEDPLVKRTLQGLFRPSLGQWNGFLREVLSAYQRANRQTEMLIEDLSDAYNKKRRDRPAMADAYNLIVNYTQNRHDSATTSLSVRQFCDVLINYRNKTIGHGAITRYHCEQMNDPLFAAMEEMLGQLSFLQEYRLVYVEEVRVRRGNYTHELVSFMGSTPPSRLKEAYITANKDEYRVEEQLYLCKRGENVPVLSLHPLVIAWQNDVLFLNESERDRDIEYLSYQSGQIKRPDRLLEDFKDIVGSVIARDSTEPSFDRLRQDVIDDEQAPPTSYERGCELFDDENWAAAIPLLEQVGNDDPQFDDAQIKLAEAKKHQDLLQRYNRAQQWMEQQSLDQAQAILTGLENEAPGYRDVRALLGTIQMEKAERQNLQRLYDQAQEALNAQQWDRAYDLLGRLHGMRIDFRDVDALFAAQKRLYDLYNQGLESMSERHWAEAQTTLRQIEVLEPAYKNVQALLQRTDRELESEAQMARSYSQAKAHIALEEWEQALECLDQVDDQLDGYRDVNDLIASVQNKILVECPRCGTLTPMGHKFCGKCGAAIQTWLCWRCQTPVPVGRKFCGLCGAPREKPADPTVSCPQCGHSNPARRKFCGQCGFILQKER
ncbi:MAG: zinc ribbon domain-containing protein [Anaerolineae bacterium]|nr:zinc ribbon domain-containing protein [Anaerolineae bacterium]